MKLKISIINLIYTIELKYFKINKLLNITFNLLKVFFIFLIKINDSIFLFYYISFNKFNKNLIILIY